MRKRTTTLRSAPVTGAVLAALVLAFAGCSTDEAAGDKKLSLLQPADQTLARGTTNEVAITVTRLNFDAPVDVRFENLPDGVKVVESKPIPEGDIVETYTLHAGAEADLVKDHSATVVIEGPDGLAVERDFEITVKE